MDKQVKQCIEQLNNGEIPKGYKKTDFGIFPSDWVTDKTLGDLFDFYGGHSKSRDELGEKGYAYLHYGDMHRGSFNTVSIDKYEQLPKCDISLTEKEKCLMKDGDVAFLDASEDLEGTSRAVLIDNPENKPFIAGLHIIYGKAKNNSLDKWFKQYITSSESVKKQFQRLAVGFKVYGVNRDTIPHIRVAYPPSNKEQSRIAEILMKWDEAIELYDKQIDALTRYKAVCLKKMFPAKGQNVPEWRFQSFTGDWEQRKLRAAATFSKGSGYSKNDLKENGTPIILYGRLYTKYETVISEVDTFVDVQPNSVYSTGHEVIVPASGETAEDISRASFVAKSGILLGGDLNIIVPDDYINPVFLALTISNGNQQKELSKRAQGKSVVHIHNSDLENVVLLYPSYDEQEKIGEYFSNLDHLITLHQRKKETIKKQRNTLQQYLLNGIVRVKT